MVVWSILREQDSKLGLTQSEIYRICTTTENSNYVSAVCTFRLQDVMDSFKGAFKVFQITTAKKNNTRKISVYHLSLVFQYTFWWPLFFKLKLNFIDNDFLVFLSLTHHLRFRMRSLSYFLILFSLISYFFH